MGTSAQWGTWELRVGEPAYTKEQLSQIESLEQDLRDHMAQVKPRRYQHSLSVAHTAEQMALVYGVDPFDARVGGILHDWDKVLTAPEQVARGLELGVDLGVDISLVQPLLHGITAARSLPACYPQLGEQVWQAIERHTIGHANMSPLDMVLFVADGIEPLRADVEAIRAVRNLVDVRAPLADVYWSSFSQGVAYVIQTERYLYPGTLDIYNELVLRRRAQEG